VSGGGKNANVSIKEKELLNTFEEAKEQQLSVKRNLVAAKHEVKAANGNAQQMIVAKEKLKKKKSYTHPQNCLEEKQRSLGMQSVIRTSQTWCVSFERLL